MASQTGENEEKRIEELSGEAEFFLEVDDTRKDLKEKRGFIKENFYNGSKQLKHIVPKGKHI